MSRLRSAELAWYATGRFYRGDDGRVADYGYLLHLSGFEGEPFARAAARSERTAYLTFAATPFNTHDLSNGTLALSVDAVGEFSLYLQRTPYGDFDDPRSFAEGERIGTFRRTSLVVGTTVDDTVDGATVSLFANNVFSARLIDSVPFEFAGVVHDIAAIVGAGVTQFGTCASVPIAPPPRGYDLVLPFTGSAIALGA